MKVYIVSWIHTDDYGDERDSIVGVFSTLEQAYTVFDKDRDGRPYSSYSVRAYTLDETTH